MIRSLIPAAFVLVLATVASAQTPVTGATAVATGDLHACAIVNGGVKCWGHDFNGQLGVGGDAPSYDWPDPGAFRTIAADVVGQPAGAGVDANAAGPDHTCALKGGGILCWGRGGEGQLGNGFESLSERTPVAVTVLGGQAASAIAAAIFYTCAIADGGVFCWGDVPGFLNEEFVDALTVLPAGSGATAIAAGYDHACAVVHGGVQCWGNDESGFGALGDGAGASSDTPVVAIPAGAGATAVAAGYFQSCAIVAGALTCWGINGVGELATGVAGGHSLVPVASAALTGSPADLDAGWGHACTVVAGGVQCWGGAQFGPLGGGDAWQQAYTASPIQVVSLGPGAGATDVSAGMYLSCAVAAGRVYCWGYGEFGELGNGAAVSSNQPVAVLTDAAAGNAAPELGPVTIATSALVGLGTPVAASAAFTDADGGDSHTCVASWGDGGTTPAPAWNGTCGGTHTYASPGVYVVTLAVADAAGASDASSFAYVVVYDPSAGFVTGGGWFESAPGAFRPDPSLAGRAHLGFVARYQSGRSIPVGHTELQFNAAGMSFRSSAYEWLVVGGAKATYKGTGTVNGGGDYAFQLTAIDGHLQGGGVDRVRMRIWDRATGTTFYDNQACAADQDDADPCTALAAGEIVIHAAKK